MVVTFDPAKREKTIAQRGMDFIDAEKVFEGDTFDISDLRRDYGEQRVISIGFLHGRMVIVVWTQRGNNRHIISMRKANGREQQRYRPVFSD